MKPRPAPKVHLGDARRRRIVDQRHGAAGGLGEELAAIAADEFFVQVGRGPDGAVLDHAREADADRALPFEVLRHGRDCAGHLGGREIIGGLDAKPLREELAGFGVHGRAFECGPADVDAKRFHENRRGKRSAGRLAIPLSVRSPDGRGAARRTRSVGPDSMTPAALTATAFATAATAATMCMAVRQLFGAGLAHRSDLDVERKIDAGQWVIGIEHDLVALEADDRHDGGKLILTSLKRVADLQLTLDGQLRALDALHLRGVALAVGPRGRDLDAGLGACGDVTELLVEPIDDLARTLEISDRRIAGGRVEDLTLRVTQHVMKTDDTTIHGEANEGRKRSFGHKKTAKSPKWLGQRKNHETHDRPNPNPLTAKGAKRLKKA
jgi:hypothetical protein